jgi:hypothetical protein
MIEFLWFGPLAGYPGEGVVFWACPNPAIKSLRHRRSGAAERPQA